MCRAIGEVLPPTQRGGAVTTLEDLRDLLPEGTVEAWPKVAEALPAGAVLMGGTALAVWLRHRRSEDLDFFAPDLFDGAAIATALSEAGEFAPTSVSDRMIRGTFDAVKLDVVASPGEFTLGPSRVVEGLKVGSLEDITAAKFKAITDRRQLRDFIDVMCVERDAGVAVEQGLILYCRKHGVSFDLETVRTFLRHLADFRYLDDDPAMHATFGVDVRHIVMTYFQRRIPQITASLSRLFTEPPQP
ncbi:MAG: nucleotidyl transferase AbiEii/AbiGii toxin family protein [Acidimicrobiia bacterium]|nr:nucleotidyl transferase AbiEii/AbiGii toxin family protein [Acidimicrobiia bacterium]